MKKKLRTGNGIGCLSNNCKNSKTLNIVKDSTFSIFNKILSKELW